MRSLLSVVVLPFVLTVTGCKEEHGTVPSASASAAASVTASAAPSTAETGGGRGEGIGLGNLAPAKGVPWIRIGEATVTGTLPHEVIDRMVRSTFPQLRACYDTLLRTKSDAHGTVAVTLSISETGAVVGTADSGSDIGDPTMIACVTQAMSKLQFPKPESGTVKAVATVSFDPNK